mmetsp:Transcript_38219/g.126571  ORF Transcript_38219/g.126571 Transcript_38219/m.126571 type:complete len:230 (+) Transcript_38219:1064-1753(+)
MLLACRPPSPASPTLCYSSRTTRTSSRAAPRCGLCQRHSPSSATVVHSQRTGSCTLQSAARAAPSCSRAAIFITCGCRAAAAADACTSRPVSLAARTRRMLTRLQSTSCERRATRRAGSASTSTPVHTSRRLATTAPPAAGLQTAAPRTPSQEATSAAASPTLRAVCPRTAPTAETGRTGHGGPAPRRRAACGYRSTAATSHRSSQTCRSSGCRRSAAAARPATQTALC